jgi:ABC-2 type transport system ATP-binding protein
MSPDLAIETARLSRRFGPTVAVAGIDLAVPAGTVYGLLGPNGAGKSTTIRMLATLLRPDGGTARVAGYDVVRDAAAVRARIGLTGQLGSLDEDLTGKENLILIARLLGHRPREARARAARLLEAFGLVDAADRQLKRYSGGMRRRLDIAATLVTRPEVLFLDEPTTGLDPHNRREVWAMVRGLTAEGTTVLLTTQYLDEADQLADRVAVIDHGRVVAEGPPAELKTSVGGGVLRVWLVSERRRAQARLALADALEVPVTVESDPAALSATVSEPAQAAYALAVLADLGIGIRQFALGQPSLDEVFLSLTGHKLGGLVAVKEPA